MFVCQQSFRSWVLLLCVTRCGSFLGSDFSAGKNSAVMRVVLSCFPFFCNILLFRAPFAQLEELYKIPVLRGYLWELGLRLVCSFQNYTQNFSATNLCCSTEPKREVSSHGFWGGKLLNYLYENNTVFFFNKFVFQGAKEVCCICARLPLVGRHGWRKE